MLLLYVSLPQGDQKDALRRKIDLINLELNARCNTTKYVGR